MGEHSSAMLFVRIRVLMQRNQVSHTGIFSADIDFPEPVDIFWAPNNGSGLVPIGTTQFAPLTAKKKRAFINQTSDFAVTDQGSFGEFTKEMITSQNFTWVLKTKTLSARALRLPKATGLNFEKNITLNGTVSRAPRSIDISHI
jgi:hypothetical protein